MFTSDLGGTPEQGGWLPAEPGMRSEGGHFPPPLCPGQPPVAAVALVQSVQRGFRAKGGGAGRVGPLVAPHVAAACLCRRPGGLCRSLTPSL